MSLARLLTLSELARLREIIGILMRYGLGDVVSFLKLDPLLAVGQRLLFRKVHSTDPRPVRFRKALEELGPTFSKLGQILSARQDLLGPEYIAELSRLQDRVTPMDFQSVQAVLEEEWGVPPLARLLSIDPFPLGQATIAQVHRGCLPDGTQVAVKIQRPGLLSTIEADLTILSVLSELLEDNLVKSRRFRPQELVRSFARTLRQEVDFTHEGRNIDRAANNFRDDPEIVIPRHFPDYTTRRVIVLEYLEGVKIDQTDRFEQMGTTPAAMARVGARAILKQVFVFGFFQGDPHPGNILVLPGSRIGILDFGMFGTLSKSWRLLLGDLLSSLVENDTGRVIVVLRRMGAIPDECDLLKLESELSRFLEEFVHRPLSEIRVDLLASELFAISRDHALKLPPDLVLLLRAFVIMEGIGRRLDPDFNLLEEAKPFMAAQFFNRMGLEDMVSNMKITSRSVLRILAELPKGIERLLDTAGGGRFRIDFSLRHLEELVRTIDRTGNLLALSVLVSSLVIGSALIFSASLSSHSSFRNLGLVGFTGAGALGFFLAIVILRSRRF